MTGYGATFRMWREDYAHGKDGKGRDYNRGEWRHTIAIRNSRSITIEGLTLEESGGDGGREVEAVCCAAYRADDGDEAVVLANGTWSEQSVELGWNGARKSVVVAPGGIVLAGW